MLQGCYRRSDFFEFSIVSIVQHMVVRDGTGELFCGWLAVRARHLGVDRVG